MSYLRHIILNKQTTLSKIRLKERRELLIDAQKKEIDKWLSEHPEVDKYVILDDDTDMLPKQISFFVKTNPYEDGLNVECKDKAIEILNNV